MAAVQEPAVETTYGALRRLAHPLCSTWEIEHDPDSVYVRCRALKAIPIGDFHDDKLAAWRRKLEVIELLALVRLVDPPGWVRLMGDLGLSNISRCVQDRQLPAYTIAFDANDSVAFIESVLSLVVAPAQDRECSQPYLTLKQAILATTDDEDVHAAIHGMRIPMRLVDRDQRVETQDVIVRWLTRSSDEGARSLFELTGLEVEPAGREFGSAAVDKVHHYVSSKLPLDYVKAGARDVGAGVSRLRLGQFLADVLGPYGPVVVHSPRPLDRRATGDAYMSAFTVHQVMRAQRLHIANFPDEGSMAERRSRLLWTVYGLFSHDARHAIATMVLPLFTGLKEPELQWLTDLLRRQRAPRMELLVPELFDEYESRDAPTVDRWVTVPRGHPIRLEEGDDWRDHALRFHDDLGRRFRVIRDDASLGFLDILVPGYGCCRVDRGEGVRTSDEPLTPWRFDGHAVQTLEVQVLSVSLEEQRGVALFLGLVGAPVKMLRVYRQWRGHEPVDSVSADFLAAIVRSCTRLERLVLCGVAPADNAALVRAFADNDATRLHGLVFDSHPFLDRTELLHFFETLCDPSLVITRKLRELAINLDGYELDQADTQGLVDALLHLLETNQLLKVVHVSLSVAQADRFARAIQAHDGRALSTPRAPLPMRAKCALLSGLRDDRHAWAALDASVLTLVFAFAAECETRRVSVAHCLPDDFIHERW